MNFELAAHRHEEQLRELLRGSPMPGWIRLAFGRDPDFFHGIGVQGAFNQVIVALERDRVVGMGCRSLRQAFVNGRPAQIGYLSGLRLHPDVRGASALARGYAMLRNLHDERPAPVYLTTIVEDNAEAMRLLASGRAGLPHYLDFGRCFTYAISLNRRRRKRTPPMPVVSGENVSLEAILRFLDEHGLRRQFFPALSAADFGSELLRGLALSDFRVALRDGGEIAGLAAAWDQSAFKQHIVHGYAAPLGQLRPAVNACLRLAGYRPLPAAGQCLRSLHIAFPCARDDDPAIFAALLESVHAEQQDGERHFLVVGLHERDPLKAAIRHFPAFRYASRCYLVCWDDGLEFVKSLDPRRVPYLEAATL